MEENKKTLIVFLIIVYFLIGLIVMVNNQNRYADLFLLKLLLATILISGLPILLFYEAIVNFKNKYFLLASIEVSLAFLFSSFIIMGILGTFNSDIGDRKLDIRRISNIRQIELGLELYYAKYKEYPSGATAMQELIDKSFLNMSRSPIDQKTKRPYCYAWGEEENNKVNPVQYYHLGAVLYNPNSDVLCQDMDMDMDMDFDSGADTKAIWHTIPNGDCAYIDNTGFNGAGTGTCNENSENPIYDRGVFPK